MFIEVAPRQDSTVSCPVNGTVGVTCIRTDDGILAWCRRSGLVCAVKDGAPACPLTYLRTSVPPAARWACPWDDPALPEERAG